MLGFLEQPLGFFNGLPVVVSTTQQSRNCGSCGQIFDPRWDQEIESHMASPLSLAAMSFAIKAAKAFPELPTV